MFLIILDNQDFTVVSVVSVCIYLTLYIKHNCSNLCFTIIYEIFSEINKTKPPPRASTERVERAPKYNSENREERNNRRNREDKSALGGGGGGSGDFHRYVVIFEILLYFKVIR